MQYEKEKLLSISRPAGVCALCGGSLVDDPKHPSVLREVEGQGADGAATAEDDRVPAQSEAKADDPKEDQPQFIRSDYHGECWEKAREGDYLSFWLAKRPTPPESPRLTKKERNEALVGLLHALMKSDDSLDEPIRFTLSHLLMRYRSLNLVSTRLDEEGCKWILFEFPRTEEQVEILDLRLSDEQIIDTMARIEQYLQTVAPESDEGQNEDESKNQN